MSDTASNTMIHTSNYLKDKITVVGFIDRLIADFNLENNVILNPALDMVRQCRQQAEVEHCIKKITDTSALDFFSEALSLWDSYKASKAKAYADYLDKSSGETFDRFIIDNDITAQLNYDAMTVIADQLIQKHQKNNTKITFDETGFAPNFLANYPLPATTGRKPQTSKTTKIDYGSEVVHYNISTTRNKPLPSGKIGRLLLLYICTLAKKEKTKVIDLSYRLNEVRKELSLAHSSTSYKALKDQFHRIRLTVFAQTVTSRINNKTINRDHQMMVSRNSADETKNENAALEANTLDGALFDVSTGVAAAYQDDEILTMTLDDEFYNYILRNSAPLPFDRIKALPNALDIDLCLWMLQRVYQLHVDPSGVSEYSYDLEQIMSQMLDDEKNPSRRISRLKDSLNNIKQIVYPQLECEIINTGRRSKAPAKIVIKKTPLLFVELEKSLGSSNDNDDAG